ncbi:MAG: hypothetical protein WA005_14775 [Candidatus Binataceae bacterium]
MTENGYPYSAGYANFDSPVILPVQFYELVGRRHVLEGEYKLMFAVLEDAIHTCFKNLNARTPEESQELFEVQNWFDASGTGRGYGLFAFENLCEALGLEPDRLRKRLLSIRNATGHMRHFRRTHSALGGLVQPRASSTASSSRYR